MQKFDIQSGLKAIWHQRQLLRSLVIRDIQSRYKGTFFGVLWLVIYPLLTLAVYSFVFGGVFKSRWMNQGGMADFVVMLFCGLIVYNLFAEVVNRSPGTITGNQNFVKKVVFPLELLPLVSLGTALFNTAISLSILCLLLLITRHSIPGTAIFAPLVLAPLLLTLVGLASILSALGVFFRDLSQIVGIVTTMLLFLSPVFFPVSSVPESARLLLHLNPLTYPIEEMRHVLISGIFPDWGRLAAYFLASVLLAWFGFWAFQRSRPAFADVL